MASLSSQVNRSGTTWRVKWRKPDGQQTSMSFANKPSAERFKDDVEQYGSEEALRVLAVIENEASVPTVTEYLTQFINNLTGVQPATVGKYRAYLESDITPVFGSLPIVAVTEHTIGAWVTTMAEKKRKAADGIMKPPSRKTLQNKHAFLSGALKQAVKEGLIPSNPCIGRRLPETQPAEKVFLTPQEFALLHSKLPERWRSLAVFLVLTGLRFSEATALTPKDIDPVAGTCRVSKSWKYTGVYQRVLGPPKTRMSVRTISLSPEALAVLDLTQPEWLFTNGAGNPVTSQEFFNLGWKPARTKAIAAGLTHSVRVHDLRHTCASWMIQAGIPLPVVQAHLGHENIHTTISTYFHADQRQGQLAAAAVGNLLRNVAIGATEDSSTSADACVEQPRECDLGSPRSLPRGPSA